MSKIVEVLQKHGIEAKEDLLSELESVSKIPDSRFSQVVKERNDLRAKVVEWDVEKNTYETKLKEQMETVNGLKKYESKVKEWEEKRYNDNLSQWKQRKTLFEVKEGDKLFEKVAKVKHRFQLGEELTPEQIQTNLEMLKTYDELDYFKVEGNSTNYNNKKPAGTPRSSEDFYGYGSREELAKNDLKLYIKWKNAKE